MFRHTIRYFQWEIAGTARDGQTWKTKGLITTSSGNFDDALISYVREESFRQLTHGKAVYGRPGEGCSGPYKISKMLIEEKVDEV